jgi:hypothetical protein
MEAAEQGLEPEQGLEQGLEPEQGPGLEVGQAHTALFQG